MCQPLLPKFGLIIKLDPHKATIKQLPKKLQKHPDVRGRKGNPNGRKVPEDKHKEIHQSCPGQYYPGGKYNKRADELVEEARQLGNLTPEEINRIRRQLIEEFDL